MLCYVMLCYIILLFVGSKVVVGWMDDTSQVMKRIYSYVDLCDTVLVDSFKIVNNRGCHA